MAQETYKGAALDLDRNHWMNDISYLKDLYLKTLKEVCLHRYPEDESSYGMIIFNQAEKWLNETDFFTAPASTRFHEAYPGGLVLHHLKVYNEMVELYELPKFHNVNFASAALVALIHDWCKIQLYTTYTRNVKDENGQWHAKQEYKYDSPKFPLGHGGASMFLGERFFKIKMEECLAIRWHMGRWYCSDSELTDLQTACETYPLVHMLQFADQLAITNY